MALNSHLTDKEICTHFYRTTQILLRQNHAVKPNNLTRQDLSITSTPSSNPTENAKINPEIERYDESLKRLK